MLSTRFFHNPQRKIDLPLKAKLRNAVQYLFIKFGLWLGFQNIEYSYIHGDKKRLIVGNGCSTMNSLFNVISGEIVIGDNTIIGHDCTFLTGTHQFIDGVRGTLHDPPIQETPLNGRNIVIGSGCFIGSKAIIVGKITIGDNVLIGAGAVVTEDIPDGCFAAGVPARIVSYFNIKKD
jgi:acetyltransferase-like isoleucine patch superfamily enzyme